MRGGLLGTGNNIKGNNFGTCIRMKPHEIKDSEEVDLQSNHTSTNKDWRATGKEKKLHHIPSAR